MSLIEEKHKKDVKEKRIKKMIIVELGIILLALAVYGIGKYKIISYMPNCPIHEHFGVLCPSCGGTRCVVNFFQGNFWKSFQYHPIFFVTILYLIGVNILYIVNTFRKEERQIATYLYPTTKFWIGFLFIIGIYTIFRNIL